MFQVKNLPVLFLRNLIGKHFGQGGMLSRATRQNETMLPFVFDDDDDWHTWPGDPDILWASVFLSFFFAFLFFFRDVLFL